MGKTVILTDLFKIPFDQGLCDVPQAQTRLLFWNIACPQWLREGVRTSLQPLKPSAMGGEGTIVPSLSHIKDPFFDYIFLAAQKNKIRTRADLANASKILDRGGVIIAVAANDAGGQSLERMMLDLGFETQSLSKSKHRIVIGRAGHWQEPAIERAIQDGARQERLIDGIKFITRPGIFGWDKIDTGSNLLMESISHNDLSGRGADFGCGYGYLTMRALQMHQGIEKITLIDADYEALDCARHNVSAGKADFFWEDLTSFTLSALDFIVMNPPFHDGKAMDHALGLKFIENAARSLKSGGCLWMVANRHLPYERALDSYFRHKEIIKEAHGFKIFKAVK